MIRVKVPLDVHAVALGGSGAFALATPLRIADLLEFAVREAVGLRAPHDKFSRSVHRTLAGGLPMPTPWSSVRRAPTSVSF
jgi:hypothetical protein